MDPDRPPHDDAHDTDSDGGPPMPGDTLPAEVPPMPSPAIRIAQQILIPALIVVLGIGAALLFVMVASGRESIEDQVSRLPGCGGADQGLWGFQDPRYKDCWRAAFNIAGRLDQIEEPRERAHLHEQVAVLLNEPSALDAKEGKLSGYLLSVVGRLGAEGGIEILARWLGAASPEGRMGAVKGLLAWPDDDRPRGERAAAEALPLVYGLLADENPDVAFLAAALVGDLALTGDQASIEALRKAMDAEGPERRYVRWQAAIGLARLGDAAGSRLVAELLLDRQELAKQADQVRQDGGRGPMRARSQDDIMLSTLMAASDFTDPVVWTKIERVAKDDPSPKVRVAARQRILERKKRLETDGGRLSP